MYSQTHSSVRNPYRFPKNVSLGYRLNVFGIIGCTSLITSKLNLPHKQQKYPSSQLVLESEGEERLVCFTISLYPIHLICRVIERGVIILSSSHSW